MSCPSPLPSSPFSAPKPVRKDGQVTETSLERNTAQLIPLPLIPRKRGALRGLRGAVSLRAQHPVAPPRRAEDHGTGGREDGEGDGKDENDMLDGPASPVGVVNGYPLINS